MQVAPASLEGNRPNQVQPLSAQYPLRAVTQRSQSRQLYALQVRARPLSSACKAIGKVWQHQLHVQLHIRGVNMSRLRKGKEDLEELIGTRMASLTGDLSKFESSVEDRLRNVEGSLTRKMENIYKTLTSVF